ncbi:MAG: glycoside hydrolase family 97 C-terminal domain-containing protein, partial [Prevotella sp.]|nr:glycoside hydrolase family 97 C-terminal domain-containing protein [Prevotella sp.]
RRKGRQWFVGAITGSNPQDLTISLDFLEQGGELQFFQDGANAHRIAVDYKKGRRSVTPSDSLRLHLARNGGWCGVIQPQ